MSLCPGFRETGGTVFRCALQDGHYPQVAHRGFGARSITYATGLAPEATWRDTDPGAQGSFRKPDDSSGKTPFDGQQVIPRDSTTQ